MAIGSVAIALSSPTGQEHSRWQEAAEREGKRYGIEGSVMSVTWVKW
jgi:hypothetical protein